ncbi:MAG: chorismate mutase [Oscillospiraceae bacterium]|nr:chorismate mutase [Oscillospiraceae bacterium]
MTELEKNRKEITEIDALMAELFERRMMAAAGIADYKKSAGLPVKDYAREQALIERNSSLISDPELRGYYMQFLRSTIDISCSYQSKLLGGMRVAYSGEKGAFAYIAAKKMFPTATLVPFTGFPAAYEAAEKGECDVAVLPIENSYAGEVGAVMDLIFSGSLYINQVTDVPIAHCLLANEGATVASVKKVISHPQAIDQCMNFIEEHGYATESYVNTALAAKYVAESGRTDIAAIASAESAEEFGLGILYRDIHDNKSNTTRFGAFSGVRTIKNGNAGNENFILAFTVRNEAGALAQALDIIGSHGFNMRALRSRPNKSLQWSYFFYIEAEGNINSENGDNMLRELSAVCDKLRLAGSYFVDNTRI